MPDNALTIDGACFVFNDAMMFGILMLFNASKTEGLLINLSDFKTESVGIVIYYAVLFYRLNLISMLC